MIDVTLQDLASSILMMFEGCYLTSYMDSGGVWTVGIGHTKGVTAGMHITTDQVAQFFAADQAPLFKVVSGIPILEAAALISFGFNCGLGALESVIAGHDSISNPRYTHDMHGNTLSGLVNRRRLEELLCALSQQLSH